jgi:hypothetical protein
MRPAHEVVRINQSIGPHAVLTPPLILLVIVNLLPIAGALLFDWSLFALLLLYWGENGIVGLYTIAKMLNASKQGELGKSRSYLIIFYITHYSTFWVLHGVALVFVLQTFGASVNGAGVLFFATLALYAVQHAMSHKMNWLGQREFERISSTHTMALPYVRVGGTLILSIVAAFTLWQFDEPPIGLAVFAALKLVVDAASHVLVHRALAAPSTAQ